MAESATVIMNRSLFLEAIRNDDINTVKHLLEIGLEREPFHVSRTIQEGRLEILKLLISNGYCLGKNDFSIAINTHNYYMAEYLLSLNTVAIEYHLGITAAANGNLNIMILLCMNGLHFDSNTIAWARHFNHHEIVVFLEDILHPIKSARKRGGQPNFE
jgi:hypothetical protein